MKMSEKNTLSGKDSFLTCSEDLFEGFIRERLNTSGGDDADECMDTDQPTGNNELEVIAGEEESSLVDSPAPIKGSSDIDEGNSTDNGESVDDDDSSNIKAASSTKTITVSREKFNHRSYSNKKSNADVVQSKPISVEQLPVTEVISQKNDNGSTKAILVKSPVSDSGHPSNANEVVLSSGKKLLIVPQKNVLCNGDVSKRKQIEISKEDNTVPVKRQRCILPKLYTQGSDRKSLNISGISSLLSGSFNEPVSEKLEVNVRASSHDSKINSGSVKNLVEVSSDGKELFVVTSQPEAFNFKKPLQLNGKKALVGRKLVTLMQGSDNKRIFIQSSGIRLTPIKDTLPPTPTTRVSVDSKTQKITVDGNFVTEQEKSPGSLYKPVSQLSPSSMEQRKRLSESPTNKSETGVSRPAGFESEERELSEMYLRLLNSRALPVYEPPAPQPFAFRMLSCVDCQDKFTQKSSLDLHRARRSMLITYWCGVCQRRLSYFNRCALLTHLRTHNHKLSSLDPTGITIQPLPSNLIQLSNPSVKPLPAQKTGNPSRPIQTNSVATDVNDLQSGVTRIQVDRVLESVDKTVPAAPKNVVTVALQRGKPATVVKDVTNVGKPVPVNGLLPKDATDSPTTTLLSPAMTSPNHDNKDVKSAKLVKHKPYQRIKTCPECKLSFGISTTLQDHLLGENRPLRPELQCNACSLVLPTSCSLRMHLRIHIPIKPHRCPECGVEYENYDRFMKHIKFECCHQARVVKFMCTLCGVPETTLSRLRVHVLDFHTRRVFKCSNCSIAFLSKNPMAQHYKDVHPGITASAILFSQCKFCPDKMIPQKRFPTHVARHLMYGKFKVYMYECYGCEEYFKVKKDLIDHFETCVVKEKDVNKNNIDTKKGSITVRRSSSGAAKSDSNIAEVVVESPRPDQGKRSSLENIYAEVVVESSPQDEVELIVPEVEVCARDPLSLDDFEMEEQPVSERLCVLCKKAMQPGDSESLCCSDCVQPCSDNDLKPRQGAMTTRRRTKLQTIYSCKLCSYQSVVSFDALLRHFRVNHKGVSEANMKHMIAIEMKNVFHSVRSKTVTTAESIKDKYLKKKKNNAVDNSIQVKEEIDADDEDSKDKVFVKKSPGKVKGKGVPCELAQFDRGLVIAAAQPTAGELNCAKCSFVAACMSEMRAHVPVHRTDPSAPQCLDCGECFVVLPSLEKHLAIRHHIGDVAKYMADNPGCLPPPSPPSPPPPPSPPTTVAVDPLKCSVCLTSFESQHALDKHFRIHGMAFLKQTKPIS
ncbi:zinc finger protein 532 isoform X2 [Nilaparvata lugens]|nr:zinc finger protein 532 isoform X2 [Nilaparvata lugens]XP_039276560.1 zinc finger protein 532 isoform X2 [Nilaparvata lugens]